MLTPEAKQPFELKAHADGAVEGASTPDYPLQKKRHSVEFLRTIQHLRPRTNLFSAVFPRPQRGGGGDTRVLPVAGASSTSTRRMHHGLSDCEGAGEMFERDDARRGERAPDGGRRRRLEPGLLRQAHASLTVSGQLNAENFAMAFGDVYTFGPTFRAEKSNTQRHAAEFWMIEPEMAFADLSDYMDNAEAMIKYVINRVLERCPQEMEFFQLLRGQGPAGAAVPRGGLRLRARQLHGGRGDTGKEQRQVRLQGLDWGCDLQTEHERYLTEQVFKKPIFVTDYPKEIKAFYMRLDEGEQAPSPPPTAWCPPSASSSAAASARSGSTSSPRAWTSWG